MGETTDDMETRAAAGAQGEPMLAPPLEWKGRRVGRYLVLERLGSGGMGEVYLAYDPQLDRRVALKLLRRDRSAGEGAQDRLLREAQALAKLSHPNVVSVHDVGTIEDLDAGIERTVYVAMEYIEGPTLRAWATEGRSWREIVVAYRAAGAGLAAAHRQGIVHRDFKPTNVIVGDDGRVRVLDFGLARRVGEPLLADADLEDSLDRSSELVSAEGGRNVARSSSLDVQLTQTGLVLGTPAYMAPEQFAGDDADRRGDLFSFCVALWEALYGQRPFAGDEPAQIVRAVRAGRIREPARKPGEPGRLRAVLRRGLAAAPADRPPDMDALLADIDRVSRPVPRSAVALGGAVLVAAGIIAFGRTTEPAALDPCAGAREQLDGVWDGARKHAIVEAFGKTAASYAADASTTVVRTLDGWTDAWVDARTDACVATRIRGDQSEELMDLRIACLDQRRAELAALVDVFAEADAQVVQNAIGGAMGLRSVDACSDFQYLRAAVRPPDDPVVAASVADLRARLAAAHALVSAGKYKDGFAAADAVLAEARPLGYDPLVAEAALASGEAADRASRIDEVEPRLDEAIVAAARCGHAMAEAEALGALTQYYGVRQADIVQARRTARHAAAVSFRAGDPPALVAGIVARQANAEVRAGSPEAAIPLFTRVLEMSSDDQAVRRQQQVALLNLSAAYGSSGRYVEAGRTLSDAVVRLREDMGAHHPTYGVALMNLGATEWKLGKLDEALADLEQAETVLSEALGASSIEVGQVLHNRGVVLREKGEHEQALRAYERALVIKRAVLGPDNPSVALTSNNIGTVLHDVGRDDEAEAYLLRAIEMTEKSLGREHPEIGHPLSTLGLVLLARGDVDGAIPLFEEAIAVRAGIAGADETTGEARLGLARALAKSGRDPARARELAVEAHELFTSDPNAPAKKREEAAAFLAELGG